MAPSPHADGPGPTALIVVRNGVTHDARVLREAEAAREAGLRPLVVGVTTARDRPGRTTWHGVEVLRLDPAGGWARALRRILRRSRGRGSAPAAPPAAPAPSPSASAAPGRRSPLRRALVSAAFTRAAIGVVLRTRPALVHCNDFNTMWVGVAARLLSGARVIYDSHELWADRNGRPEWRPGLIAAEALFVRAADRVLTTSPGYAEVIARRYRVPHPQVVRNIPAAAPAAAAPPAPDDPPVAAYVGGLLRGRGLEESIAALAEVPGLRLRLIGPGRPDYRAELIELAERHGVADRLELRDPVAPTAVVDALRGATLGLALIQPVCLSYQLTLPNKLFEYAAAGLPMVVSDLPVMAALTREWGCGEIVAPTDVSAIVAGVRALLDPDRRRRAADGARRLSRGITWAAEREALVGIYMCLATETRR